MFSADNLVICLILPSFFLKQLVATFYWFRQLNYDGLLFHGVSPLPFLVSLHVFSLLDSHGNMLIVANASFEDKFCRDSYFIAISKEAEVSDTGINIYYSYFFMIIYHATWTFEILKALVSSLICLSISSTTLTRPCRFHFDVYCFYGSWWQLDEIIG
jgi:hypothetical protein